MCSTWHLHTMQPGRVAPAPRLLRRLRLVAVVAGAALATACATGMPGGGPPDPGAEAALVAATAPTQRLQVIFDWDIRDRDARFNGQGVLRLDLGYRARVDLFGPRGETLSAAVLEGGEMRVVPVGSEGLLPPPALLWSVIGVFRPPVGAPLTGTGSTAGALVLDYARDDARWRFRFQDNRLRGTEWTARGGRRTVELAGTAAFGLPAQANFRDWTEFRELTLRVTEVEERTGFGPDVWILPGT